MIAVESLSRRYGSTQAVDNVSFAIGTNEVVGLLGHNGAGKTTIMRMLSGYLEPSAGTVTIAGINMASNAHQIQATLGYLPEHLPIYPEMLVADYLDYVATLKRIPRRERPLALQEAIAATSLGDRALDPISQLSRGLRQRVGVAQAILGQPQLLILDEPTNGLDPGQTAQMRDLLRRLARRATVILSTHIMQEVEAVCDRVLVMAAGRLVLDAPLATLRESRTLVLRAGTEEPELERWLRRLPQIAAVHPRADIAEGESWVLTLRENADPDTAANNIAQCVVRAGASLFQLQPQLRDLDSIFREATSGKPGP
ncbi:MAG TPA: multidrug ABC transporter ATP-binding protein [Haliea salexigens]|uniref:Multidrug ABC transporter ATP-binding protein n=1 Tax=Haliea salexigens TaxID=287487 RepID=A0A3C1KR15_9GAMM|nr:multidrug ABC transporter ATP-binding protein [Haliea sp.]HAN28784.1 multidrug ABC transporter ATP-binding protein [Haliea salexigens]HAN69430.1 multidrug ABC transporter ATP-binding protein [Halieaceae bacterium]|tara:strand:- start:3008 stop:3946 length:939 start_codon:yes stop_codon:yes gene_type:complete